jgi:hypothetical protein
VGYTAAQIAALTPFPFEEVWVTDAASTASCTVALGSTPPFKCVYISGSWVPEGGGGASCSGTSGNLLGLNGSACAGMPGSTVDFTNGLLTLAPIGSGPALTITQTDTVLPTISSIESYMTMSNSGGTGNGGGFAVVLDDSGADNGTGEAVYASGSLNGTNVGTDYVFGVSVNTSNYATGGIAGELSAFYTSALPGGTQFTSVLTGLHIGDESTYGSAQQVTAAVLLDSQTPNPGAFAIKSGTGPVDFGDIVSPGILTLADALSEITTTYIGAAVFLGTGTNDLTSGGTYSGTSNLIYCVQIDSTGTPDTFEWGTDNCATFPNTGVAITGAAQTLSNGVTVTFASTTTHTIGDHWTIVATAALGDGFEWMCADCDTPTSEGAVCTTNGDGAGAKATYVRGAAHCF